MRRRYEIIAAAALAVGTIGLAGTSWAQQTTDQQSQRPGQTDSSTPAPGAAAGAETASDRQSGAGASAKSASSESARKAVSQTAQAVLGQDGASGLSQQLSQSDRARLKDLDTKQIDQQVQQLRQAYKAKYQKDLDLSASQEQVFSATFIRVGDLSDSARQAGARIGSDLSSGASNSSGTSGATGTPSAGATATPSAGASGTSGAGATGAGTSGAAASDSGTAGAGTAGASTPGAGTSGVSAGAGVSSDAAQTAGSTMGMIPVTISAGQGTAEANVKIANEGGTWVVDVPDSIDSKTLSQNLQQHLAQAAQQKDQWPADANQASQQIVAHVLMAFADPSAAGAGGAREPGAASGTPGASGSSSGGTGAGGTGTSGASTGGTGSTR